MKKKINLKTSGFKFVKDLGNGYKRYSCNGPFLVRVIEIKDGIVMIEDNIRELRTEWELHGYSGLIAFLDINAHTTNQRRDPKNWWICPMIPDEYLESLNGKNPKFEEIIEYSFRMIEFGPFKEDKKC